MDDVFILAGSTIVVLGMLAGFGSAFFRRFDGSEFFLGVILCGWALVAVGLIIGLF